MALIECYECKQSVSEKASACPRCGAPVVSTSIELKDIDCSNFDKSANGLWFRATNLRELGEYQEAKFTYFEIINMFPNSKQAKWAKNELGPDETHLSDIYNNSSAQDLWLRAQTMKSGDEKILIAYDLYNQIIDKFPDSEEANLSKEHLRNLNNEYNFVSIESNLTAKIGKDKSSGNMIGTVLFALYFIISIYYWFHYWNESYPYVSLSSIIAFPIYSIKGFMWPILRLFGI